MKIEIEKFVERVKKNPSYYIVLVSKDIKINCKKEIVKEIYKEVINLLENHMATLLIEIYEKTLLILEKEGVSRENIEMNLKKVRVEVDNDCNIISISIVVSLSKEDYSITFLVDVPY